MTAGLHVARRAELCCVLQYPVVYVHSKANCAAKIKLAEVNFKKI